MLDLNAKAIQLHAEVNGWLYNGAKTVLEDQNVSVHVLLLWLSRMEELTKRSRELHKAVDNDLSKRAWKSALELKIKIGEKLKKDYGII